jgi:hypothetical protein
VQNAENGAMEWHAADGTVLTQEQWNEQAAQAEADAAGAAAGAEVEAAADVADVEAAAEAPAADAEDPSTTEEGGDNA